MKLIPASRAARYMRADIASSASPPNDNVPKHNCETCTPVRPKDLYCMASHSVSHAGGNDLTRHEGATRASEEEHDLGNLIRLTRLSKHVQVELVLPIRVSLASERRVGQAGVDGVHGDAVLTQSQREALRQRKHSAFGGGIVRVIDAAVHAPIGRDQDHGPRALLRHDACHFSSDIERPIEIDAKHAAPIFVGHLEKRLARADAGGMYEDIHPAVSLDCAIHQPAYVRGMADVGLRLRLEIRNHDVRAFSGEELCRSRADSGAAAGDHHDLAAQRGHYCLATPALLSTSAHLPTCSFTKAPSASGVVAKVCMPWRSKYSSTSGVVSTPVNALLSRAITSGGVPAAAKEAVQPFSS